MPSVWNLDWLRNFVSRSKNKQHRLTRRKSSRPIRLHLEPFEDRITPAANDLVFRALDATPLTLQLANGVLEIVNSADPANVLASQDYSATNQVLVAANGFDVQLTVDVSMRAVPGGIVFDGGNGDSSLIGPGHDVDWHVTSAGSGDLDGPGFVTFYGVSNLTGAAENRDTFIFSATGSLAGVVDGGPAALTASSSTAAIMAKSASPPARPTPAHWAATARSCAMPAWSRSSTPTSPPTTC